MANIVSEPTHLLGGTLDLVVPIDNLSIVSCSVQPSGVISDHSFIEASMSLSLPPFVKTKKHVRSWSRVDNEKFIALVEKHIFRKNFDFKTVDEAVDFLNVKFVPLLIWLYHCMRLNRDMYQQRLGSILFVESVSEAVENLSE
ncbi:hypothetical protein HELRODRAFT_178696 [Helobdella robusta]|uniref:Endonuclease/exonuclease/phosphatase domain-containing protein n=1 Tax=Helobdella robusta TaxID=6412 RepID=T1FDL0_HELRO|nr:hypothetical protein HELRODRAFT_178696 [Helobdella robusta]ESN96897.1 hypothetical protein HELRODRAFT_178696 [Helobdella robusta]